MEAPDNKLNLSSGEAPDPPPTMSIDKLFPALLECFGIILCGYVAGRINIITSTQAKGLGSFVSKFALPALLFKNMVLLDFGHVIWPFFWSILIAKVSVFFVVCALTLLVASPETRFSKAGLFSIFATQSNDFALGYPIVQALYGRSHPEYLQYIYLVAPVSLMLLNPIGFGFCEVQRWRDQRGPRQQSKLRIVGVVVLQVLKNPIVFMVVIGIVAHFVLDQRIPAFMEAFVDGLASSFGGTALFYLGLSMVGHLGHLTRATGISLILLITAKLLVMPLISREMVEILDSGTGDSLNHSSLSNYAFLYGVFPTAPSVAIYAAHYGMELQVVTSGMVLSTILSAPIMYVSAWLLTIPGMDPKPLVDSLQSVSFNISIVSLVALVWTIAVMFLSKKFRRLPHMFTVHLFFAQFLACVGMILWNFVVRHDSFVGHVLSFILLYGSLYSTYIWPGLIALSLVLMKRDEGVSRPGVLVITGWGVPVMVTAVLLLTGERMPDTVDSAFFYGRPQMACTAAVLALGMLLAGASLMGLSRGSWAPSYQALESVSVPEVPPSSSGAPSPEDGPESRALFQPPSANGSINRDCHMCDCAPPEPLPDMVINASGNDTMNTQTGQCGDGCASLDCLLAHAEQRKQDSDRQLVRHVLLCLLLTISLFANFSSCLWWLFNDVPGRLYLELQFFCAVVNYGQGFISFGMFGLDKHLIILPFKKRIYRLWRRKPQEAPPPQPAVSEDVQVTCSQFTRYHQSQCVQDIVQEKRCGERRAVGVFLGSDLVDWLLRVGLASDRGAAALYGSQLQQGGLLQHITHDHGFQDDGSLHYRFTAPAPPPHVLC